VHQQDVFIVCRLRGYKIRRLGNATFQEALVDQAVFLGWKNVGTYREIVIVAVDELKG
jgi:hypothetical protein